MCNKLLISVVVINITWLVFGFGPITYAVTALCLIIGLLVGKGG